MAGKEHLSQTMRIDLIPDVPAEASEKGKRVVISTATRKIRRPPPKSTTDGSDSRYQQLLQSIYDAALITDMHGHITDVNARAVDFLLYSREDLCNLALFDIVSGADEALIQTLSENLENERFTLIQAYCIRRDGTFFPAEIAVNKLRFGDDLNLCFFIRDITLRRQAEEMLRTEHNAIQNAGNGIAVTNMDVALEYVNPAFARMWGYANPADLLRSDARAFFAEMQAAQAMVDAVLGAQQNWSGEMRAHRPDGTEFDVQVSAVCNRNSDGEAVGMVISFVDVSDRRRAEHAEREAERRRVMLESLGAACHHLGQPATVLLANIGIMQHRLKNSDETVQELVKSSIDAAETLGEILHKLNTVNEYKTMQYLESADGSENVDSSRIIEI
jgi:PAS domain S-box-containing protein